MITQNTTVGALLDTVAARARNSQHLVTGAPTRKPRRPGTAAYYGQCIARIVKSWPELVNADVRSVSLDDCADWFTRFQKLYCPEACNGGLIVLRAAFRLAVRRGYITADPTADLQRALIPERTCKLPDADQWQRALAAMISYAAARAPHRHTIRQVQLARWLAATGMRPAASVALCVGDVDLEAHTVRLDGKHAKNGKTVTLPIGKDALEVAREAGGGRSANEKLFRTTSARGVLGAASKALGIKISHSTLRKLFATRALESGVAPAIAARLLTHQDGGQTLLKHYAQWRDESLRAAVVTMDASGAGCAGVFHANESKTRVIHP